MRPFLPISLPPVPPLPDFAPHAPSPYSSSSNEHDKSEKSDEQQQGHKTQDSPDHHHKPAENPTPLTNQQILTLVKSSDLNLETARKEWTDVSATLPEPGGYVGSEVERGQNTKNVLRSVIAARLAVSTVKKWLEEKGRHQADAAGKAKKRKKGKRKEESGLEVDITGAMYHPWWIVPKVKVVA